MVATGRLAQPAPRRGGMAAAGEPLEKPAVRGVGGAAVEGSPQFVRQRRAHRLLAHPTHGGRKFGDELRVLAGQVTGDGGGVQVYDAVEGRLDELPAAGVREEVARAADVG